MTEINPPKLDVVPAASPALAESQADQTTVGKLLRLSGHSAASNVVSAIFDGHNPPEIVSRQNQNNLPHTELTKDVAYRQASLFADAVNREARAINNGDRPPMDSTVNAYHLPGYNIQPVSNEWSLGMMPATISSERSLGMMPPIMPESGAGLLHNKRPLEQLNASELRSIADDLRRGREQQKPSRGKYDNPSFEEWKKLHGSDMNERELKLTWLENDFRANPEKYKNWYRAANKRTQPLPVLEFNPNEKKLARQNSVLQTQRGLGHHGASGFENASSSGDPEDTFKMWLNSPGHLQNLQLRGVKYFAASVVGHYFTMRFR